MFSNSKEISLFFPRLGQRLNIVFEQTPESLIYDAMKEAERALPERVNISNFTSIENVHLEAIAGR